MLPKDQGRSAPLNRTLRGYFQSQVLFALTIHSWSFRLIISLFVFVAVSGIVVPHLMDVDPPKIVDLLLWPMHVLGPLIGKILPRGNIGTPEQPVYEGTPLDFVAGFALAFFSILLYPTATFLGLALFSRIVRRRNLLGTSD
jgi:hypothetical protein